jgi:hypothetical protein
MCKAYCKVRSDYSSVRYTQYCTRLKRVHVSHVHRRTYNFQTAERRCMARSLAPAAGAATFDLTGLTSQHITYT